MNKGIKEIQHQRKIIEAAEHWGGAGDKWSSAYEGGKPDLILTLPGIGTVLMEVKVFHDTKPGYDRSMRLTRQQEEKLDDHMKAGGICMIGLVTDNGSRDRKLHLVHPKYKKFGEYMEDTLSTSGLMPHGGHVNLPLMVTDYLDRFYKVQTGEDK